jgi:heterodisulfide reductase subunit C
MFESSEVTVRNQGEITAAVMAMQHMLVKKGICTFDELSAANARAQELVSKLGQAVVDPSNPDLEKMQESIKDMLHFIGGEAATPALETMFADLGKVLNKE